MQTMIRERFLRYVQQGTRSDEHAATVPSTTSQTVFLAALADELHALGLENVRQRPDGYVFAELASNLAPAATAVTPVIGFIAHVDTADFPGANVQPQRVSAYDGQSVIPLGDGTYQLSPADFPNLKRYRRHDLITTDGTTLLGADDKAGVAEIISAAEHLIAHPDQPHGKLVFAFGPDEEIGRGADHFDVADFGADFAYTVDGGPLGELEWETFNAASAQIAITGRNVHPGTAKDTMVNALQVAMDFHAQLPEYDRPEHTSGRQGFWHLLQLSGTPEAATMDYIVRDHDRTTFTARKRTLETLAATLNARYDQPRIVVTLADQYYNMGDILADQQAPVQLAQQAMRQLGIQPVVEPVRGGTDGSKITFLGLPTPNLFAGAENMHGRFEFVSEQVMVKAAQTILMIAELATKNTHD